jgi:NAD(P)H-dependent flavin oxidoreductase YrpB (nitropropane dioxygenase family)
MGAEGIEMGTRFVATRECVAHANYKQALVAAKETDTVVIERTLGRPARVLRSPHVERILALEQRGAPPEELMPFIAGERNRRAAIEGDMEEGFAWAGQSAGFIEDVPSVAELVARTMSEAEACFDRVQRLRGK